MEVFLVATVVKIEIMSLLHACGGVSIQADNGYQRIRSSPRMWRCFLKILKVVQHNGSLLHACGGVSPVQDYFIVGAESSPRMWRCFYFLQLFSDYC